MSVDHGPADAGLVIVGVVVPAPVPAAWRALTLPERVRRWFGDLDVPMTPGAAVRVDFGDGDFFRVRVDDVRTEEMVSFRWRFLGVGPESQIRWELASGAPGTGSTTVTVSDTCPGRPPPEAAELDAGWRDFLGRLGTYLASGESARYAWRQVIDGGVDLPASAWLPLTRPAVAEWLPITPDGDRPRRFLIADTEGPRGFAIDDWDLVPGRSLRFSVAIPEAGTTHAEVSAASADGTVRLTVRHAGWDRLTISDVRARALRRHFAAAWTAALETASDRAGQVSRRSTR